MILTKSTADDGDVKSAVLARDSEYLLMDQVEQANVQVAFYSIVDAIFRNTDEVGTAYLTLVAVRDFDLDVDMDLDLDLSDHELGAGNDADVDADADAFVGDKRMQILAQAGVLAELPAVKREIGKILTFGQFMRRGNRPKLNALCEKLKQEQDQDQDAYHLLLGIIIAKGKHRLRAFCDALEELMPERHIDCEACLQELFFIRQCEVFEQAGLFGPNDINNNSLSYSFRGFDDAAMDYDDADESFEGYGFINAAVAYHDDRRCGQQLTPHDLGLMQCYGAISGYLMVAAHDLKSVNYKGKGEAKRSKIAANLAQEIKEFMSTPDAQVACDANCDDSNECPGGQQSQASFLYSGFVAGRKFVYVDFTIWNLPKFLQKAAKLKDSDVLKAYGVEHLYYHSFERNGDKVLVF